MSIVFNLFGRVVQKVAVAYIDDNDLIANRE